MSQNTQRHMESSFGADFSRVRIHTNSSAVQMSQSLNAQAFAHGGDIYFNSGKYNPDTSQGKHLLAHELTHTIQQGSSKVHNKLQRSPVFPNATCSGVSGNIQRAWPTALLWVREAIHRLQDPAAAADLLQTHFKIDPNNPDHQTALQYVIARFNRMEEIFAMDINSYCDQPGTGGQCLLVDGRTYAAYVSGDGNIADGIHYCMNVASSGLLTGESLIHTIVHEVAHWDDVNSTDYAYRYSPIGGVTYQQLTMQQAILNADCYSSIANDV